MTKKRFSKLLSVILALAICATTVFGCLITANAATPCYAWSDGKVADDGQTATINLTITAPDLLADYGFQSGSFTLTQDTALTIDGVEAASGTQKNGSTDVSDIEVTPDENGSYLFDSNSFYSEVVFKITYKAAFEKGKEYAVNVTSMELANSWDKYTENASGKAGVIRMGCDHVVSVDGLTPVATGNGYSVYENAVCAKCGENIGYQLVPTESLKTEPNVIYNNGTYDRSFLDNAAEGVGDTAENPYIIKTVAQLHALVRGSTYEKVTGKYFKIDNGIDIICLQPYGYFSDVNEFLTKDSSETKTYLEQPTQNGKGRQIWWSGISNKDTEGGCAGTIPFDGHLDFNGATVMGMYNTQGGLFAEVGPNATFKNVSLKNLYSYNEAGPAGTIAGYANSYKYTDADSTEQTVANGNLEAENIEISNCYVNSKDSKNNNFVGALIGRFRCIDGKIGVHINNCFAYNNTVLYNTEDRACLLGDVLNTFKSSAEDAETGGAYIKIENTVTIGITPYHALAETNSGQSTAPEHFENVYSDKYDENLFAITYESWNLITAASYKGKLEKITTYQASGLNALDLNGLDFVNTWHFDSNGGYPSPVKTEDVATVSQSALNLKAVNLTYATDGTFDINFYYEPVAELADIITTKVCVGVADGSALYEAQGAVLSDVDCETLGLNEGALCYTIGNIPARKIGDLMLPTVVAKNVGTTIWGATKQLSVADYAKAVIDGDGIYYPEATTDTEIEQDKKIAAAVINYGAASVEALAAENANEPTKKIAYMESAIHTEGYFTETDASFLEGHEGSEKDPYIISTPKQLYHIVKGMSETNTDGKYFKVDPSVDVFVLQTKSYMDANGGLDAFMKLDAQGVKDFFDTNTTGRGKWMATSNFKGNIDFSGVRIVGMYTSSFGMINLVHIGASFKDVTMSHCYNISGDYSGTIAGRLHNPGGDTGTPGTVTFDKIALYNNYQENTGNNGYARTGVLFGASTGATAVKWSNLLVYDNIAKGRKSSSDETMMDCALVGSYTRGWSGQNNDPKINNGDYSNSIILGCYPYPIQEVANHGTRKEYWKGNVYTDADVILEGGGNVFGHVNHWDAIGADKIIKINAADLKGENAKDIVLALNNADEVENDVWYVDAWGGYPSFTPSGVMPNQYQSEYDGITVNGNISYGGNNQFGVYRTTVGLKTKPYVAFTFAFGSENGINYRKERENITVKVVGANGNTYYNGNVPAYEADSEGNYIDLVNTANGCTWINRAENVRYHLLKLENINVQDLTDEITVTISYGEKVVTSQFSLGGFAKNYSINYTNTGSNYYLARANAVKALIYYSDALKARYGA